MPPYHQAPQRKSRTGLWIGLAVVVVLAIVAVTVTTVFLLTRKQDITELTASMLLPESDFPALEAGEFVDEPIAEDDEYDFDRAAVDPAECARTVRAVDHPELPDWAVAVAMDTDEDQFVYVSGYYRGVQVDAEYFGRQHTKSDLDELVRMFNAQVDRPSEH